jgi:Na+/proline symporter
VTALSFAILGYLAVQFGIGIWASRRIRTEDDYLVAGRRLGYPLAIFSIFATWFGAETCIGAAGNIYENGVSLTTAEPFGYGLCLIIMGAVFAAPLWRRRLTTLADLFRLRYSVLVERTAAVILIPSSILWAAAQIRAFGHVLSTTSTLPVELAITVAAGLVVLYTAFGGLLADAVTDLVQGIALTVGLVVLLVAAVAFLGGPVEAATALGGALRGNAAGGEAIPFLEALEAWAIPVCGSVVATELVSRVIATRTPEIARRSSLVAGGIYITVGLIPVFIGLTGALIVPGLTDAEQLLPAAAQELLPAALYALFAGALISAILSTVDSTLLVASGLLSHNLVVPLVPGVAERAKVLLARVAVGAFGIMAYVMALNAEGVLALVEQASAFGSAGALIIVCFGLFSRFGGASTALATLVVGIGSYTWGIVTESPLPFLTSLVASLATYLVGGAAEVVWSAAEVKRET